MVPTTTRASTKQLTARMGHANSAAALRYQHAVSIATADRDRVIAQALPEPPQPAEGLSIARKAGGGRDGPTSDAQQEPPKGLLTSDFFESERRESNPRSQLGKLMFCR